VLWYKVLNQLPTPVPERRMELPNGKALVGNYPNKGAAIAWANRAQALLLAGEPKAALRSARRATEANPEYLKAHHREMKALEALGEVATAKEIGTEIQNYSLARSLYPCEAVALLMAGWVRWERAKMVYSPIRFRAAADAVVESGEKKVEARASIVPFQGGQLLMMTLVYGSNSTIECMDFTLVDTSNAAIADLPPHGHASDAALKHAPIVIGKFIAELAQWELETVALMCGQGLVEHVDHLDAELKAGRPGLFEPIEQMLVYASSSTHASQAAGASADVYNRRAMEAMMARLGL